jgi:hypothetical protein
VRGEFHLRLAFQRRNQRRRREVDAAAAEHFSELFDRPRRAFGRRLLGGAHQLRHFPQRARFEVAEGDGGAVGGAEAGERVVDRRVDALHRVGAVDGADGRVVGAVGGCLLVGHVRGGALLAPLPPDLAPQRRFRRQPGRRDQPAARHVAVTDRPGLAREHDKRGLCEVLGDLVVPDLSTCGGVDRLEVPVDDRAECALVAPVDICPQEFLVRHRLHN